MFVVMPDFDAPPSLSAAFADHRTHSFLETVPEDEAPAPVASVRRPDASASAEKFLRRHQLGKTGVILYVAGNVATVVGVVAVFVSIGTENVGLAVGGVALVFSGAVTTVVGEVFIFTGGIGASKVLGESTVVGWVGVGLAIGGVTASFLAPAVGTEVGTVASLASIGGLVCGAVQLGQAGAAGRRENLISLHVAPTPNGLLVAGAF